jgi:hypothetical protein
MGESGRTEWVDVADEQNIMTDRIERTDLKPSVGYTDQLFELIHYKAMKLSQEHCHILKFCEPLG